MLPRLSRSMIVMNSTPHKVKCSLLFSSHTLTPSFHSVMKSSTNGSKYTSISFSGYFGPWISKGIIRYVLFIHSHGGMLYIQRVTGQVLCLLLTILKGFTASVLNPNLMFLISLAKVLYLELIALHCEPSAGCISFSSTKQSLACHLISLAVSAFANHLFKRGIIGKYHTTFLGGLLFLSPFIIVADKHLYQEVLHTGHESKSL